MSRDLGEKGICFGLSVMVNRQGFRGESYLFWPAVMVSGGIEDGLVYFRSLNFLDYLID